MACRFSRQLFYILAAVCMCSWIGITLVVIKSGGGNTRIEFDLNTPFVLNAETVNPNMKLQSANSVNKENEHADSHANLKGKQSRNRKGHEENDLIDDGKNEDWNRNIVHNGEGDDGKTGQMNAELDENKDDSGILKWNEPQNLNNKYMKNQKKPVVIEGYEDEPDAEIIERNIVNNGDIEDSKEVDKAAKYRNEKIDEDAHDHVFDDGELEQGDSEDDNYGDIDINDHEGQNNGDDSNEMHLDDVYYNKESTENGKKGKDKENDKAHTIMPRLDSDDYNEDKARGDGGVKENIYINNGNGQKKEADLELPNIDNNYGENNDADQLDDQKEEMNDADELKRGINQYRENTTQLDKKRGANKVLEAENHKVKENKSDHLSKDTLLPYKGKNPLARLNMLTNDNNTVGSESVGATGIIEAVEIESNHSEQGQGLDIDYDNLSDETRVKLDSMYVLHGFNAYISDLIPTNRSLPDVRSEACKRIQYNLDPKTTGLPQTSVIILFHNEALSVLLRTIKSIINRTPDYLLKEIILVDDYSTLDELKSNLDSAIKGMSKVHLIRTPEHLGIVKARLIGAQKSTAEVLTFLDSHVECFQGWLEPLLARLVEKPNTVVYPRIHSISGKTFKVNIQDKLYVGGFQLSDLIFDWIPVQYGDQTLRTSDTNTARSPAFSGGLFSMYKDYFYKVGAYDEQMELWGGEHIEMSLRLWMCGGSIEVHPCSNVAHLFRQTNPLENSMRAAMDSAAIRNNLRVANVWLDDYKKFYREKGMENVSAGDTSHRQKLRHDLGCQSFQWYIDNVYPGLYVSGQAVMLGEIRNPSTGLCIDSGINVLSAHIIASECRGKPTQFWHLSKLNALQREIGCLHLNGQSRVIDDTRPTLERCDGGGPQQSWIYTKEWWLFNPSSKTCLGLSVDLHVLQVLRCEYNNRFYWKWKNTGLEDSLSHG